MISVCIPWRDNADRRRSFDWCKRRWQELLPDAELVTSDDPTQLTFSRSRAINQAARQAIGDVLILADADTTIDAGALHMGLVIAIDWPWVIPYTKYFNLDERSTRRILNSGKTEIPPNFTYEHLIPHPAQAPYGDPVSGVVIVNKAAFEAAGGFDERFQGWGYEDNAFTAAMETLVAPARRVPNGAVYHLWHPVAPGTTWDSPTIEQNKKRFKQYERARGNRDAMRSLKES